jgi:hypothetical protein
MVDSAQRPGNPVVELKRLEKLYQLLFLFVIQRDESVGHVGRFAGMPQYGFSEGK